MSQFFQEGPQLANQYDDDRVLQSFLRRKLPSDVFTEIEPGLRRLGERAVTDILALGDAAEAAPPRHVPYDPWGRRIDRIDVSRAWQELERISAEEGIVASAYERRHGAYSRIHQFARLYLFGASSAVYTCPLAMTDGAARILELHGDLWLRSNPLPRLTSRDPKVFWTSGQWMTERTGGSDVSGTSTIARPDNGLYRLHGTKWFTSATTSPMAMTLARIEDSSEAGRDLSLFYVETKDSSGRLQNITIQRLKDKLGTRAVPTAELTLDGTPARLIGGAGRGVRKIAALLNITRAYNACCAVGFMRRGIALARDYARKRRAFGKRLCDHPLHAETLANLQIEFEAAFHLTFRVAELMGREELGEATEQERAILRLLIPLAKLYTARQAVAHASEVLESFGGAGYVEDTGLPRLLRDAQVLSIWEGTTNVLSLDSLRAIDKEAALGPFLDDLRSRIEVVKAADLLPQVQRIREAGRRIEICYQHGLKEGVDYLQAGARAFAFSLARTYTAALLLEHAAWSLANGGDTRPKMTAQRWCARELAPLIEPNASYRRLSSDLATDG
ncbi:MAG TPA: acyl-CoA dehydrogenase family protein [Gemmataceae bacterium]|nr:acyl-CoA dehydrogenase family protein [Gemmataceae bacterium]